MLNPKTPSTLEGFGCCLVLSASVLKGEKCETRLTRGAWEERLGGGERLLYGGGLLSYRLESPLLPLPLAPDLTGLLERDLPPRGGGGSRSAGAGAGGALYASE